MDSSTKTQRAQQSTTWHLWHSYIVPVSEETQRASSQPWTNCAKHQIPPEEHATPAIRWKNVRVRCFGLFIQTQHDGQLYALDNVQIHFRTCARQMIRAYTQQRMHQQPYNYHVQRGHACQLIAKVLKESVTHYNGLYKN